MLNKIVFILIISLNVCCFAQPKNKRIPPKEEAMIAGTSKITSTDKLVESITLKNQKFNVYQSVITNNKTFEMEPNDTVQLYKIAPVKYKYSTLEITKYATRKGKIVVEGSYKNSKRYINSYNPYIRLHRFVQIYRSLHNRQIRFKENNR